MIKISDKTECCGCNACSQICPLGCIDMQEDSEGFLYPKVNLDVCIDCKLCEKTCPILKQNENRKPITVYAAKKTNEDVRIQRSSGGAFSVLAEYVINHQGVVFGAKFDDKWDVVHDYTETLEGIKSFRGSKYVQSFIGEMFVKVKEFLEQNRLVLFSGTPCQVAGLQRFIGKNFDNLITVDFVCHGVPSPQIWRIYIAQLKNQIEPTINDNIIIKNISFRSKALGWSDFSFAVDYFTSNDANIKTICESHSKNVYIKGFLNDIYLRPSCYKCPTRNLKSGSDITIADYWGIQNISPHFFDDKGVSLILVNTIIGENIYNKLSLDSILTNFNDALMYNKSIVKSVVKPRSRKTFFASNYNYDIEFCIKNMRKRV